MTDFIREKDVDHVAIFARGGQNGGDEDFWVFKCPDCSRVYLIDLEVDTVYLESHDLTKRIDGSDGEFRFLCVSCGRTLPMQSVWDSYQVAEGYWAATSELVSWLVTRDIFVRSPWAWCLVSNSRKNA